MFSIDNKLVKLKYLRIIEMKIKLLNKLLFS